MKRYYKIAFRLIVWTAALIGVLVLNTTNGQSISIRNSYTDARTRTDSGFMKKISSNTLNSGNISDVYPANVLGEKSDLSAMPVYVQDSSLVLPYSQNITPTGAMTIQVPIDVLATATGLKPTISFSYNSQNIGINNTGYIGWTLGVGSCIMRVRKTKYYDGVESKMDGRTDEFSLDGVRLVRSVSDTLTVGYRVLETINKSNIKIRAYYAEDGDYKYFDVYYPNGNIARMGDDSNLVSRLSYPITKLTTILDGSIHYYYLTNWDYDLEDPNQFRVLGPNTNLPRILRITYSSSVNEKRCVLFNYVQGEEVKNYTDGFEMENNMRLVSIIDSVTQLGYNFDSARWNHRVVLKYIGRTNAESTGENALLSFGYGKYRPNVTGNDPYFLNSLTKIQNSYTFMKPEDIKVSCGKIFAGNQDLGYVMFPRRRSYYSHINDGFRNEYSPTFNDSIMITNGKQGLYLSTVYIPLDYGFMDIFCMDVDGDDYDEIVKLNSRSLMDSPQSQYRICTDTLAITVFKVNELGVLDTFRYFEYEMYRNELVNTYSLQYNKEGGEPPVIPKEFLQGDFLGTKRSQLVSVRISIPSRVPEKMGLPAEGNVCIFDLMTGSRINVSDDFQYKRFTRDSYNITTHDVVMAIDIDADGRSELCRIDSTGTNFYRITTTGIQLLTSTNQLTWKDASYRKNIIPGDFNGDGMIDFVSVPSFSNDIVECLDADVAATAPPLASTSSYVVNNMVEERDTIISFINAYNANAMTPKQFTVKKNIVPWYMMNTTTSFFAMDVDGDGKSDLVETSSIGCNQLQSSLYVHYMNEHGRIFTTYTSTNGTTGSEFVMPSLEQSQGRQGRLVSIGRTGVIRHYAPLKYSIIENLITEIRPNIGVRNYYTYQDIGDNAGGRIYSAEDTTTLTSAVVRLYTGLTVVRSQHEYDGDRFLDSVNYHYKYGFIHKEGLGFLGFREFGSESSLNGCETIKYDPFRFGIILSQENKSNYTECSYKVEIDQTSKRRDIALINSKMHDKVNGKNQNRYLRYDNYNYPLVDSLVFDNVLYAKVTRKRYDHRPELNASGIHLLGLPVYSSEITMTPNGMIEMRTSEAFNAKGQTIWDTTYRNNVPIEYTLYAYNGSDLLYQKITGKLPQNIRINSVYTYDPKKRMTQQVDTYQSSQRSFTSRFEYDDYDKVTSSFDNNDKETIYLYNTWYDLRGKQYPDGSYEMTRKYVPIEGEIDSAVCVVETINTKQPIKRQYLNALGQTIVDAQETPGANFVYVKHTYDKKGRRTSSSYPYMTVPVNWYINTYDGFDRLVKKVTSLYDNPNLTRANTYQYIGDSIISIENGHKQLKIYDPLGRVIQSKDSSGTVNFNLLADGQPSSVQTPVNTISFLYDNYGRKVSRTDPATTGTTTCAYGTGTISDTVTKADGKKTISTYLDAGPILSKVVANGDSVEQMVTYNYDNKLRLLEEVGTHRSRGYEYDEFGRQTKYIDILQQSGKKYGQRWGYNEKGELSTITHLVYSLSVGNYESEEEILEERGYYAGELISVRVGSGIWIDGINVWQRQTENEMGQWTSSITDFHSFYQEYNKEGQVSKISIYGDHRNIEEQYSYDKNYNLVTRSSDLPWNSYSEVFGYDHLNRIKHSGYPINYFGYDVGSNNTTLGNLTLMPGISQTTYDGYKATQTQVFQTKYNYIQHEIVYDAQERPIRISEYDPNQNNDRYILRYSYDHNGDKVSSQMTSQWYYSGPSQYDIIDYTRYYFGDQYEFHNDGGVPEEYIYIGGDAYSAKAVLYRQPGVIIMVDPENSDETMPYPWEVYAIGRDVQGSSVCFINRYGTSVGELWMNEWGLPKGNVGYLTSSSMFLPRAFGSHEYLVEFGLYHMNARLYDPVTGRFMSPDPFIQDPYNFQNHNPYTYCLNNPFKYTDPSGEFFVIDSWIMGCLSGGWKEGARRASNDMKIWRGLFRSDPNKNWFQRFGEVVSRFTWQLPQTLGGWGTAQAYNTFGLKGGVETVRYKYGATVVTTRNGNWGAVTQGCFIVGDNNLRADPNNGLFQHEYGHYIQSQKMGWAYYPRVGIPSALSSGDHNLNPVEQDANRRAFLYFNKNVKGFYDRNPYDGNGWDFSEHPLNVNGSGMFGTVDYNNSADLLALDKLTVRAKWYDYGSWLFLGIGGPVWTGLINTANYN